MESNEAIKALAALAHGARLAIFRMLVRAGEGGLAAGEIARRLQALPNTLSANLNVLVHAGLIGARREGRSILYAARYDRMRDLLAFLLEDCCNGTPEICAPIASLLACCPADAPTEPVR